MFVYTYFAFANGKNKTLSLVVRKDNNKCAVKLYGYN